MIQAIYIILFGLANMLRGWGITGGKALFAVFVALSVACLLCFDQGDDTTLVIKYFLFYIPITLIAISFGWGKWVGAALHGVINQDVESEDREFDKVIARFENNPRIWGALGLTYRGGILGLLLGAPLLSFWMPLAGLTMGICFVVAGYTSFISKYLVKWDIWKVGEGLFGMALGAALLKTFGMI